MKDILMDAVNGGLLIRNGDLVVGDATLQHQAHLLARAVNDFKQYPSAGVDLTGFLNDEGNVGELRAKIVQEFEADGFTNISIKGKTFQELEVNASN